MPDPGSGWELFRTALSMVRFVLWLIRYFGHTSGGGAQL
jgi:hypothetical protein